MPKNIERLNDLFLFKFHNTNEYFKPIKDMNHNFKERLEDFICKELEWVESEEMDGLNQILRINPTKAIEFIDKGMFNYLLTQSKNENYSNGITINMIQTQSQYQSQSIDVSIVINSIKESLTKEDFNKLKTILNSKKTKQIN
jgi:hypothetical protein